MKDYTQITGFNSKSRYIYYINIENYDDIVENNTLIIDQDEYGTFVYANKAGTAKLTVREGSKMVNQLEQLPLLYQKHPVKK